jgi:Rieske 2Fe-2S family protein
MTAQSAPKAPAYTGLGELKATLPSQFYFAPDHYEQELKKLWYRNWVYLCRASTLSEPRAFRTFTIGNQSVLVLRDEHSSLRAFHNTCRHRGSVLCSEEEGRLRGKNLVCPYHGWSYSLEGDLMAVPKMGLPDEFDQSDYSLYKIALAEWGGCVFIRLEGPGAKLDEVLRPNATRLANWPMETLATGHVMRTVLACNWKVFWENFNECYHCPGVHPELSRLVPIYNRTIMGPYDDPSWENHKDDPDPRYRGGLRQGAVTWSVDGQAVGAAFPGLTEEERGAGHRFVTLWPTMYVVGHIDHMRMVTMRPLGPEQTELTVQWLFDPATLADPGFDLEKTISFAKLVVEQDGAACELNQKGLRSVAHRQGVLMPQEYAVHAFHEWVRNSLAKG